MTMARPWAALTLLALPSCAHVYIPTQQQVVYHAVDCYDGQPAHGGMRVQRYGPGSECPDRQWLAEEWELLQRRLKIDDDLAISQVTLIYYTEGAPCDPGLNTIQKPRGCWKAIIDPDKLQRAAILFVDQAHTYLSLNFKRYHTWPQSTWHEVCHALEYHYGRTGNHEGTMEVVRRNGAAVGMTMEYSARDRYFFQSVCKATGGDRPRLRKPLSERSPM